MVHWIFIKNTVVYYSVTMGRLFWLEAEHGLGRRREAEAGRTYHHEEVSVILAPCPYPEIL
jgi:hypothetical protein